MRYAFLVSISLLAAVACGKDSGSSETPTSPGGNGAPAYNIAPDSALATQTVTVGSTVPVAATVTLNGSPAAGVTVSWVAAAGNGVVSNATSVVDAAGRVTNTWRLGDTARTNVLTIAIVGSASAKFLATGTAGPASTLVRVSKDSSATVSGSSLLLTVRATDKGGNPVPGIVITWSATGGRLNLQQSTTGTAGNADVVFTAGTIGGAAAAYTVTASGPGVGSVSFKVVGL